VIIYDDFSARQNHMRREKRAAVIISVAVWGFITFVLFGATIKGCIIAGLILCACLTTTTFIEEH
jgi:hypothetical protein